MEEKTTEQIDAELASLRDDLAERQKELDDAESKARQIDELYAVKSVSWHNFKDRDAKAWLDASDKELFASQSTVRQLSAAVKEITERIERLKGEKVAAEKAGIEREIEAEEAGLLADSLMHDAALAEVAVARDAIYARRDKLVALGQQIGRDVSRYAKIGDHLQRSVNSNLFGRGDPRWTKEHRENYRMPFSKLVETVILEPGPESDDGTEEVING
jgi:chromosome segregation ATPase